MLIFQKSIKINDLSFYLKKTVREKKSIQSKQKEENTKNNKNKKLEKNQWNQQMLLRKF